MFDPKPFRSGKKVRAIAAWRDRQPAKDPIAGPLALICAAMAGGVFLGAGLPSAGVDALAEYCRGYADGTTRQYEVIYAQMEATRMQIELQGNTGGLAVVDRDGRLLDLVPASGEGGFFAPLEEDYAAGVEQNCTDSTPEDFAQAANSVRGPSTMARP